MNLIINFTEKRGEGELKLQKGKVCIDTLTFDFEANLDSVLISAVDKICKRNRIETLSLKKVKVAGNIEKSSSAYKIAQTFVEAIKASK
ncbi:MAG: hypothetical protein A3J47_01135 [Candidatus Yanofskybacteria bacterium RIFCSPHIGHO2_02_FULL_43_22]|uniref:Uncharacterized protein n=1 Tax=Candidatus Yanofskybacteria bacterium RIFCSPHIGHO2_02_FULL_43_22 TaxID=1802681 RepID=A0A1F8FKL8_9BACT|nr:MAG: hypothetical protein A3J47_01135 [Candidatus Yanofskybacteria bacterium RIFCSPHIGHO2_02_FULL_43_22]